MLIIACGGPSGTPVPTGTPVGSSTGQRLFVSNGCAACHGSEGMGSAIAPGLFEHSADQISRQVRAPLGAMPTYPPLKISDEELDEIVLYISTLRGDHGDVGISDPELASFQHHWMALLALEDGSSDDAVHHIDHIIKVVTGHHLAQMKKVKEEIEAGKNHEGVHTIQAMLTGTEGRGLTPLEINGGLARSSVEIGDVDGALHHLEHLSDGLSNGSLTVQIAEIRSLLESRNLPAAARALEEMTRR